MFTGSKLSLERITLQEEGVLGVIIQVHFHRKRSFMEGGGGGGGIAEMISGRVSATFCRFVFNSNIV